MSDTPTKYLLDTNVFIEASKRYYAFDLVATFWHQLADPSLDGIVCSIDKVRAEIHERNIRLVDWAENRFRRWENTDVEDTTEKYQNIIQWSAAHSQYNIDAKAEFANLDNADAWLVAHALAGQCIVVTEEVFNRDIKKRIPIPNVCQEFDVRCVDTFQMLHDLQINICG